MAEVLGVIGTVAAVAQIAVELVKLGTTLRRHIKAIRKAPDEVRNFLYDSNSFVGLIQLFVGRANEAMKTLKGREERTISHIYRQCKNVSRMMMNLVGRFAELANEHKTPIENLLLKLRWIFNRPDVQELRLGMQMAMTTVNCVSTLLQREIVPPSDMETRMMINEQLRNLLPALRMSTEMFLHHQRAYRAKLEQEIQDLRNEIQAVSRDIQRQIHNVTKAQVYSGATYPSPSEGRRRRRHDGRPPRYAALARFPSSLALSGGTAGGNTGSKDTSPEATSGASFDKNERVDTSVNNREGRPANESLIHQDDPREYYELDISDPMKPRITGPCNKDCLHKPCEYSGESHCIHNPCLCNRGASSSKGKPIPGKGQPDGTISRPIVPVEDRNDRGKYKDALPHDTRVRHSPQGSHRSAKRGPSDDLEREMKWQKEMETQREREREKDLDRLRPKHPTDEELYRHDRSKGEVQQQPNPSEEVRMQELRETPSTISILSDTSWTPSSEGLPSPYVPMPPFGGPGGRRRPRRPRPET